VPYSALPCPGVLDLSNDGDRTHTGHGRPSALNTSRLSSAKRIPAERSARRVLPGALSSYR
jgi:hypothetical protein